jgi:hypothetical protein
MTVRRLNDPRTAQQTVTLEHRNAIHADLPKTPKEWQNVEKNKT